MAPRRLTDPPAWRVIAAVAAIVALGFGVHWAWNRYDESYVIERRDDGAAVTRVVAATFARAATLKVGSLSGTVQSTASDTRGFGMLTSDRVIKAPFSVDYFVDVSRIGARDYRWDQASRTLSVDVPEVTAGKVNVDEAAMSLSRTRGLFVTRDAADRLARATSAAAQRSAQAEAQKPERMAAARENARRALADLLGTPLAAAGLGEVRVVVSFPFERPGSPERWDTSRSVEEVIANRR